MFQYLLKESIFIYSFIGLTSIGLVVRLILNISYNDLLNNSFAMGDTENKLLKHIKKKYETCFNLDMTVYNVDTFVDKSVYQNRSCGILLSTWETISGQILLMQAISLPIIAVWGILLECGQDTVLFTIAMGLLLTGVLIIVDRFINLNYKKTHIKINILDYLDNFYYAKLQNKTMMSDGVGERAKQLIKSLSEIAAEKDTWYQDEKKKEKEKEKENLFDEKIIEDVLKEFFT
ncbi:MAG TPA: hypothetical protein GXZ90_11045 [Clostridiales bacterium]|nr:hypothetical protein [Clostridiales bacterium]